MNSPFRILFPFLCAIVFLGINSDITLNAQNVSINPTGAPANPSAILDVNAANKGVLVPRVSLTSAMDLSTVPNPALSLLVYNTATSGVIPFAVTPGYYYWDGTKWTSLIGPPGQPGTNGLSDFAHFFAMMPPDNAATLGPGSDLDFPQDGPNSNGSISRVSADVFNLAAIGTYMIAFQVSVNEPGQIVLTLNGQQLAYTVAGRATGTSQIVNTCLVETFGINSALTVRNPAGNPTALTITPLAGGTFPVSASLVITRLQ